MPSIDGLSQTSGVADWLTNSHRPGILHIFDQVCNLVNERREVLSVVVPEIGNGPFSLVVEDIVLSDYIDPHSKVSVSQDRLALGDLTVNTATAELWSARPDWEALQARREIIVHFMAALAGVFPRPLLPEFLIDNFSIAVAKADVSSALAITSSLAGLGAGLTPAGDDFIMGSFFAAWIIHPPEAADKLGQEIVDTAAPLTTSLSAAWLKSAGRGEAGAAWHEFLDAFLTDPVCSLSYLQERLVRILEVGETSGADALSGFAGVLSASTEIPS